MVKTLNNQWLGDLAVQTTGSVEAVFEMALRNNRGITEPITTGTELDEPLIRNRSVADLYRNAGIRPATFIGYSEWRGGIGYMNVGGNFVVS